MDWTLLSKLVDKNKVGGWVRAIIGAGLAALIARWPGLKDILLPSEQAEIGIAVSGLVVGIWSHYVKS